MYICLVINKYRFHKRLNVKISKQYVTVNRNAYCRIFFYTIYLLLLLLSSLESSSVHNQSFLVLLVEFCTENPSEGVPIYESY
jgi:hypothetical protein